MADLNGAVAKTMNFVFAEIDNAGDEGKKRLGTLQANIGKVVTLPLDEIETNENIRRTIDVNSESFSRLLESIKKYGILENIVAELRVNKKDAGYKLVCIAGHRRLLAAKMAGTINKVPCLLQAYEQKGDSVGVALAENLNREDLHCLDIAEGYKSLILAGWSEEDLAKHYCRDIRTIKHYLKMADWSEEIKSILRMHSKIFSTRVIMRQFAYKKFNTAQDLKAAIIAQINPQKTKRSSTRVARSNSPSIDKKAMKAALQNYLNKQSVLSSIIKEEIQRAFIELKLI